MGNHIVPVYIGGVVRNIATVLGLILKVVPEDYERRDDLAQRFHHILENVRYTAPEAMWMRWEDASIALTACIPRDDSVGWKKKIAEYFAGKIGDEEMLSET